MSLQRGHCERFAAAFGRSLRFPQLAIRSVRRRFLEMSHRSCRSCLAGDSKRSSARLAGSLVLRAILMVSLGIALTLAADRSVQAFATETGTTFEVELPAENGPEADRRTGRLYVYLTQRLRPRE